MYSTIFVPFFSELISSQWENDWEICFSRSLKSWIDVNHFQCPVFGFAVLYPSGREIWRFNGTSKHGEGKSLTKIKFFFATHTCTSISTLRRFNQANKKNHYTLKWVMTTKSTFACSTSTVCLHRCIFQKQNSCRSANTPCIWFKEQNMVLLWELYGLVKTIF